MRNTIQTIIKYSIWAIIFAGASYVYAIGNWEEPTCNPANDPAACNKEAPLHTGSEDQEKIGGLTLTGADIPGGEVLMVGGQLEANGIISNDDGYFATNISVATATDPFSRNLVGLFGGSIGADKYCDSTGGNCTASFAGSVVYLPTPYSWTGGVSELSCPNGSGSNTCVSNSALISIATLRSHYSRMAKEPRTIKGLIIKYDQEFSGNINLQNIRYRMEIWNESNNNSTYVLAKSIPVVYDQASGYSSAYVFDSNFVVWDTSGDGNVSFSCMTSKFNMAALNSSATQTCSGAIIGYITN